MEVCICAAFFLCTGLRIKNPRMFLAFGEYTQHTIPCMDTSCIRKESTSSLIQTLLSVMESHQIMPRNLLGSLRLAGFTAGRELHPAPKICYFVYGYYYSMKTAGYQGVF